MPEKKLFDETIVSKKYNYTSPYKVEYYLYHDPSRSKRLRRPSDPVKEFKAKKLTGVCFSDLLRSMSGKSTDKPRPNRVCYHMVENPASAACKLTTGEKEAWIRMCKKHGALPSYLPLAAINNGIFTIDITDIPVSLLYTYLCCFRHIREEPGFVRSMVYLVNKKGMDFYAAYVVASSVTVTSGNKIHHPGEFCRPYLKGDSGINGITVDAMEIVRFYRFLQDPKKWDKRDPFTGTGNNWNCRATVKKAFNTTIGKFSAKELLNAAVITALKSKKPDVGLAKIAGK